MLMGCVVLIFLIETCKVPGQRVIGSYALDDLKEYIPVQLKATAEVCPFRPYLLSPRQHKY
jgi:hypothetical protein